MTTRRTVLAASAATVATLAGVAMPSAVAQPSARPSADASSTTAKPTVVLVHGAFADASGWSGVISRLRKAGYPVVAPANPLRGLASDAGYLSALLAGIDGPKVLVGHSYGGAVITQAAAGKEDVKALVYVSAFMPDKGEVLGELASKFPGSELDAALQPLPDGNGGYDVAIRTDKFRRVFAADVPADTAATMSVSQRPVSAHAFTEAPTEAAWRTIPSWALIAMQDKTIAPDLERFEAERAGSHTVEIDSSHVAMISHPDTVARLITSAAHGTGVRS